MRPIGEIIQPIMRRAAQFVGVQAILATYEADHERKAAIMDWRRHGWISPDEAELLLSAYLLEDA